MIKQDKPRVKYVKRNQSMSICVKIIIMIFFNDQQKIVSYVALRHINIFLVFKEYFLYLEDDF